MNDFIAILVLYKMHLFESITFKTLKLALEKNDHILDMIVYDNSPFSSEQQSNLNNFKISYIHDPLNPGVSKAYNVTASIGLQKGKKWMLILDQDTKLPLDILENYLAYTHRFPFQKLYAPLMLSRPGMVISPARFLFNKGFATRNKQKGLRKITGYSLINCGLCISLSAFKTIVGYDEQFKLDYSDHDFICRFKKKVSSEMVIIDSEVYHMLSAKEKQAKQADVERFKYFNSAVLRFAQIHGGLFFSVIIIMIRCFKLSCVHRSKDFFKVLNFKH